MSENTRIVREFVAAANRIDLEAMLALLSSDCVYHNIPVPAVQGHDAIRGVLQGFMSMASKVDWVMVQIAENEAGVVLTERVDRFLIGEKWLELPVMGAFELERGKITAWRDYFDMAQFQSQLPQQGS